MVLTVVLIIPRWFSAPELKKDAIAEINITFGTNGISKLELSEEEVTLVCDKFNKIDKEFSGFAWGGKGWDIWLSCSNGQKISVVGNIIVYHGIINRTYSADMNDIYDFVVWLESLKE